jgi:hypothetical protein
LVLRISKSPETAGRADPAGPWYPHEGSTSGGFKVKRIFASLVVVFSFLAIAARAADSSKLSGWISDSMCGAKHAGSNAACVKKCIEGGMAPVFVDEDKKAVWKIDNPDAVKSFHGDHVTVTASTNAEQKTVHIDSIEAAK